jgi:uncharacterized protein YydD (DUF2326 family)
LPDVKRLYSEAGASLPGIALRKYEEVETFHDAVVKNRRSHLEAEIRDARARISRRNAEREKLLARLADIRDLLSKGLSLGDFSRLQSELVTAEASVAELSHRLELANRFESLRVDVKEKELEAERSLRNVLLEQADIVFDAIATFQEISSSIYERPAEFDVALTPNGPRFDIREPAIASEGVNNMQIFTFDLMLCKMASLQGRWPGFLVHDSHLFDGVDGRQIGKALQVGEQYMKELGGQYIVTLNSDDLMKAQIESGLDFNRAILKTRLSDEDGGGLFGFRFERDLSQDEEST